ncbi:scm-like with four MBT domains protein 1 [Xenopus tropicalis]|uniref:Scm-like with four MBT domains protein 1 n=1 Tax=Xenopus tropicalis TaxID=8364 RepID=A0A8J0QFX0_XENTR|nr:scm-like with four MBT domains protein 1 [Xenopus tropicalis]
MNLQEQPATDADFNLEEAEFNWEEYLEETGCIAAPHSFFKHVDTSLKNGLSPGMRLEVPHGTESQVYWIANIITTCGKLLLLRYLGCGEDRSADFWCDMVTSDLHPLGWAQQNGKSLRPPEGIREKLQNWEEFLAENSTGVSSAPAHLLEGPHRGKDPLDLFGPGSKLELQHCRDSIVAWPVRVLENTGGRLQLQYEGVSDCVWLFYLHPSLHQVGWAAQHKYDMQPPQAISHLKSEEEWKEILTKWETDPGDCVPAEFFQEQLPLPVHSFLAGMKVEALDPSNPSCFMPATVTKVFSERYFMIEFDDLRPLDSKTSRPLLCHCNSTGIISVGSSQKMGVPLRPPPGYSEEEFDWDKYLTQCEGSAAPESNFPMPQPQSDHVFQEQMKLEAVNPFQQEDICIATVTQVMGPYIRLQLEGSKLPIAECIVHVESMDIFPMGWCETNGHLLCAPPRTKVSPPKETVTTQHEKPIPSSKNVNGLSTTEPAPCKFNSNGKYLCPKIYFNHRCFSGPYLNKGRIAELPKSVGPGSCVLVLKEVLSLLINAAYKPSRVLRELELQEDSSWPQHTETIKAKYKGKTYRSTVELVRTSDQVPDFCRKTCLKLECCPNLFGPQMVLDQCSENCSVLTKTKYTHYYGKRRGKNLTNPTGILRSIEAALKKPAKKRRRRKNFFVHKKKRMSTSVDNTPGGSPQGSDEEEDEEDEDDSHSKDQQEGSEISGKGSSSTSPTRSEHSLSTEKKRSHLFSDNEKLLTKDIRIELKEPLILDSSPLDWTVNDVIQYIKSTDCANLAKHFQEQEIDGKALLLLTLPAVQDCMDLKLAAAVRLCYHIERVKLAFYQSLSS